MHKIDHGIFFVQIVKVTGRQEYSVVSYLCKYAAIMPRVDDSYFACILSTGDKSERLQNQQTNYKYALTFHEIFKKFLYQIYL